MGDEQNGDRGEDGEHRVTADGELQRQPRVKQGGLLGHFSITFFVASRLFSVPYVGQKNLNKPSRSECPGSEPYAGPQGHDGSIPAPAPGWTRHKVCGLMNKLTNIQYEKIIITVLLLCTNTERA